MKRGKRILSLLLATVMTIGLCGNVQVKAAEEKNLALSRPATASSVANNCGPELAVNGVTDQSEQWNSENMKNGTVADDAAQTEQWLQVDLGASGAQISQIKLWYNMKVWPMVYRIETTDTPDAADSWQTVVSVARPSVNGFVQNGTGQDIADSAANTDTITLTSSPKLDKTTLGRYVRIYIEKVNAQAPGNNVNLREIEIYGTLAAEPEAPEQNIVGSTLDNVITDDGTYTGWNIGTKNVTVLVKDANETKKNETVTVEDHSENYPKEWFPAVSNANEKPEVIPTIQEWYGYEGDFTLTEDSKIIINDAAGVGLEKIAKNMQADVEEISGIKLEIEECTKTGSANDIYIESLTEADLMPLEKKAI